MTSITSSRSPPPSSSPALSVSIRHKLHPAGIVVEIRDALDMRNVVANVLIYDLLRDKAKFLDWNSEHLDLVHLLNLITTVRRDIDKEDVVLWWVERPESADQPTRIGQMVELFLGAYSKWEQDTGCSKNLFLLYFTVGKDSPDRPQGLIYQGRREHLPARTLEGSSGERTKLPLLSESRKRAFSGEASPARSGSVPLTVELKDPIMTTKRARTVASVGGANSVPKHRGLDHDTPPRDNDHDNESDVIFVRETRPGAQLIAAGANEQDYFKINPIMLESFDKVSRAIPLTKEDGATGLIQANCEHLDQATIDDACDLFNTSWTEISQHEGFPHTPSIKLKGLKRGLFPHQLITIAVQMTGERGVQRGYVNALGPGLGKTFTQQARLVFNAYLCQAQRDIERDRARSDDKARRHLPPGAEVGKQCPSQSGLPLRCPCVPLEKGRLLFKALQNGPALVVTNPGLVMQWAHEWEMNVQRNPKLINLWTHYGKDGKRFPRERRHEVVLGEDGKTAHGSAYQNVFLTSIHSVLPQITVYFGKEAVDRVERITSAIDERRDDTSAIQWSGIGFSSLDWDECHYIKNWGVKTMQLLQLNAGAAFDPVLHLSTGTPYGRDGPKDLQLMTTFLFYWSAENAWRNDTAWAPYHVHVEATPAEVGKFRNHPGTMQFLTNLYREYLAFRKMPADDPAKLPKGRELGEKFADYLRLGCIHFGDEAKVGGRPVCKKPEEILIECTAPNADAQGLALRAARKAVQQYNREHAKRVADWERKKGLRGPRPARTVLGLLERTSKARALSSIPYIQVLADKFECPVTAGWRFIRADIAFKEKSEDNMGRVENSLKMIEETSGKLQELRKFLKLWEKEKRVGGKPEKLVIMAQEPHVAYILSQWLSGTTGIESYFLHSKCSPTERSLAIDGFQDRRSATGSGAAVEPWRRKVRILVSTVAVLGTGHDLHMARRLILFSILPDGVRDEQTSQRVRRISCQSDYCQIIRFVVQGDPMDAVISKGLRDQQYFHQLTWNTFEDLVVAPGSAGAGKGAGTGDKEGDEGDRDGTGDDEDGEEDDEEEDEVEDEEEEV